MSYSQNFIFLSFEQIPFILQVDFILMSLQVLIHPPTKQLVPRSE